MSSKSTTKKTQRSNNKAGDGRVLPPVPVPEDFLNDRFSKSKLMNFRLSKERRKDLEAIVLEGAVAACQEASDSVRRLPEKEKIPQMR